MSDFAAVSELVTETMEKLGRIDYIFNNAGIVVADGEVANYTIDAWHRIIRSPWVVQDILAVRSRVTHSRGVPLAKAFERHLRSPSAGPAHDKANGDAA